MPYPVFLRARGHKFARRTSGNVNVTTTTYAVIDAALDLTIAALPGDTIRATLSGEWGGSSSVASLDAASLVGGSPVNYFSGVGSAGLGVAAWASNTNASTRSPVGGGIMYTAVSGDIVSGKITVRLVGKVDTGTGLLFASTTFPLFFSIENIGPSA